MFRKMIVGFLLVLLVVPATCADSGKRSSEEKAEVLVSKLQLTIKPQQENVEVGQPVMLSVCLKNISDETLTIECSRDIYKEYTFEVVDGKNMEAQPTNFLRQQKKDALLSTESLTGYSLKAGQSADCSLNVCTLFDVTLPGKYFVTLRRGFPLPVCIQDSTSVVSNTVEVIVTKSVAFYAIKDE